MERKMSQISAQYQVLLEEVAQQKVLIQQLLKERTDDSSIMREFPIKNITDLGRINENIEVRGKKNYIKCMTQILQGSGVVKNLKNIITDELAMQYNIDGVLGKDSLKSFTNFFDALIESIPTGIDAGSPENQLRQALQRNIFQRVAVDLNSTDPTEKSDDLEILNNDGLENLAGYI
ncbi:uncharacterized protein LOC120780867 [Bactrocera tryoni]|uniref:uncharacterized protein LOC120780867 n=1 Tax=Bactrocera tryoni TaxID=59916 RepID=UPI001A95EB86|nr:uncharacterized protein LOC120780867 [Bactrocera tryoni]